MSRDGDPLRASDFRRPVERRRRPRVDERDARPRSAERRVAMICGRPEKVEVDVVHAGRQARVMRADSERFYVVTLLRS